MAVKSKKYRNITVATEDGSVVFDHQGIGEGNAKAEKSLTDFPHTEMIKEEKKVEEEKTIAKPKATRKPRQTKKTEEK